MQARDFYHIRIAVFHAANLRRNPKKAKNFYCKIACSKARHTGFHVSSSTKDVSFCQEFEFVVTDRNNEVVCVSLYQDKGRNSKGKFYGRILVPLCCVTLLPGTPRLVERWWRILDRNQVLFHLPPTAESSYLRLSLFCELTNSPVRPLVSSLLQSPSSILPPIPPSPGFPPPFVPLKVKLIQAMGVLADDVEPCNILATLALKSRNAKQSSSTQHKTRLPVWNENFQFHIGDLENDFLIVTVFRQQSLANETLGRVLIPVMAALSSAENNAEQDHPGVVDHVWPLLEIKSAEAAETDRDQPVAHARGFIHLCLYLNRTIQPEGGVSIQRVKEGKAMRLTSKNKWAKRYLLLVRTSVRPVQLFWCHSAADVGADDTIEGGTSVDLLGVRVTIHASAAPKHPFGIMLGARDGCRHEIAFQDAADREAWTFEILKNSQMDPYWYDTDLRPPGQPPVKHSVLLPAQPRPHVPVTMYPHFARDSSPSPVHFVAPAAVAVAADHEFSDGAGGDRYPSPAAGNPHALPAAGDRYPSPAAVGRHPFPVAGDFSSGGAAHLSHPVYRGGDSTAGGAASSGMAQPGLRPAAEIMAAAEAARASSWGSGRGGGGGGGGSAASMQMPLRSSEPPHMSSGAYSLRMPRQHATPGSTAVAHSVANAGVPVARGNPLPRNDEEQYGIMPPPSHWDALDVRFSGGAGGGSGSNSRYDGDDGCGVVPVVAAFSPTRMRSFTQGSPPRSFPTSSSSPHSHSASSRDAMSRGHQTSDAEYGCVPPLNLAHHMQQLQLQQQQNQEQQHQQYQQQQQQHQEQYEQQQQQQHQEQYEQQQQQKHQEQYLQQHQQHLQQQQQQQQQPHRFPSPRSLQPSPLKSQHAKQLPQRPDLARQRSQSVGDGRGSGSVEGGSGVAGAGRPSGNVSTIANHTMRPALQKRAGGLLDASAAASPTPGFALSAVSSATAPPEVAPGGSSMYSDFVSHVALFAGPRPPAFCG